MAGRSGVIGEFTGIAAAGDLAVGPAVGSASWRRAQFHIDTTAITPAGGSFDVDLVFRTTGGEDILIASADTINSTGIVAFVLNAAFSAVEDVVPEPNILVLTRNGSPTGFAAKVYMFAG